MSKPPTSSKASAAAESAAPSSKKTADLSAPLPASESASESVTESVTESATLSVKKSERASNAATEEPALAFTAHDHRRCKRKSMRTVERLCAERAVKLTPVRKRTLEILLEAHRAIGAYDVLEVLANDGLGQKPPQVYRALGFLIEQGFAHKLEALNAYVACVNPQVCEQPCFMVCIECGRVAEQTIPTLSQQINSAAEDLGFSPNTSVMELSGVCGECPGTQK